MSVVHGSRTVKRFQSTRRTSGGLSENEGSVAHAACMQPDRTFGRTYLQRGFSGYKRPRRPKRTMPFGVKQWSAEDELPGVTRPGLAGISASTPTGTRCAVVSKVQHRGGCRKTPRLGDRHTMPSSPTAIKNQAPAPFVAPVAEIVEEPVQTIATLEA